MAMSLGPVIVTATIVVVTAQRRSWHGLAYHSVISSGRVLNRIPTRVLKALGGIFVRLVGHR